MPSSLQNIAEWRNVTGTQFEEEIAPRHQPAVLRGLVSHWPAVLEGLKAPEALAEYIKRSDVGRPAQVLVAPPSIKGRFFYAESDLSGFNFTRQNEPISTIVGRLIDQIADPDPEFISIQSAPVRDHLPQFFRDNNTDVPHRSSEPRIWIGNAVIVSTHCDYRYNIACVVGGHRRFTLFPPEQLPNLYIGPIEHTPAGPPTSLASVEHPDFARYPKFEQALAAAQEAVLGPGDAIYIPYSWWHNVQSLDRFNVLVNYWWNTAAGFGSPVHCLLHGFLSMRGLPSDQLKVWEMLFDHYVFQKNGDPAAHLDPKFKTIVGPLSPDQSRQLRMVLIKALSN